jgi:hypothetical protein
LFVAARCLLKATSRAGPLLEQFIMTAILSYKHA